MSDIQKAAVFDPRIVQDAPKFAVDKGALAVTNSPFKAIASTTSQLSFNVQVPSLSVFLDRNVEFTTDLDIKFTTTLAATTPAPVPIVVFGQDVAFPAFPFSSLVSTLTATLNDTSVTINLSDVMYEILRLVDTEYNNMRRTTPALLDNYADYSNAGGANNNPLSGYRESYYHRPTNGAFPVTFLEPESGNPVTPGGTYVSGGRTINVNAQGIPVTDTTPDLAYNVAVRIKIAEPLLLSPFIFSEMCADRVGLFGINNIQLIMNIGAGRVGRVLRGIPNGNTGNNRSISAIDFVTAGNSPFVNPTLNVVYLTPSLDLPLPPKSVVPYLEYPRFISTGFPSIVAGGEARLNSQTITLPCVPDMLAIYCKPASYGVDKGDFYFPIDSVTLNFDNFSGLGSTYTQTQLYKIAADNGLRMDYTTYSGEAGMSNVAVPNSRGLVQTVGGFLLLRPGTDFALQSGTAPSVVGQYTLQLSVDVRNTSPDELTPQLFIMTINSGFFETQAGSSRIVRGILTEQDVISAPPAPLASRTHMERMVGGASPFAKKLGNALTHAGQMALGELARSAAKTDMGKKIMAKMGKGAVTGGMATGGAANMRNLM